MSFIQFESGREKDAQRDSIRQARERILADAEDKYYKQQLQAERAKQRGEDKWMLPSVEKKLSSNDKPKKKKKKAKKAKKSKKRRHSSGSSSSDSSDEGAEWVEKSEQPKESLSLLTSEESQKPLQRDEWMNLSGAFLCSSREKKSHKDEEKKTSILDAPGRSNRELNPFWKDGGTGLPEEELSKKDKVGVSAEWLKKSLTRAKEQALEEGKSLDEIAAARWGSLDTIKSMIEEAEKKSKHSSSYRRNYNARSDRRYHRDRSRSRSRDRSRNHDDDYKNNFNPHVKKLPFKKPDLDHQSSDSSSRRYSSRKSWKKPGANEKTIRDLQEEQPHKCRPEIQEKQLKSDSELSEDEKSSALPNILTDDDLNKLGARIVKAEIMGDVELAGKLKIEIENAREARKINPNLIPTREENIILTTTNSKGMTRPLEPKSRYGEPQGGRRKAKKTDTHEAGERVRYFADDDKYSLQDMFQRERGQSSHDDDAAFVKMASKSMDMDELFEERITRGESDAKQDLRDKMRAIKEHKKMEKSLDNCRLCVDSKEMQKHLIIAMASKVYLSLPSHVSLTVSHTILAPIHHVSCQTQLDEDVWTEFKEFKKALTKMYTDNNEYPVFFEVSMSQHRFPHMQLECIALPEDVGSMAPMYFKKALLECETEWSTNKKVVELKDKDVRQVIPKGLPYFVVDFGTAGGFAHVIEDEKIFPRNFAQEIIGGMLDLDANMWRKPRRQSFDEQKKKVLEFSERWKKYDFTSTH